MALEQQDRIISEAEYLDGELKSDVKHEYLGGIVHAMAGAKMIHNLAAGNIFLSLGNSLKNSPCRPFNSDTKVRIQLSSQTRYYYPDVQVICEPVDLGSSFTDCPTVVIEVLSNSTRRVDQGEKRDAYLQLPSLKVLLLIDPDQLSVMVDRRNDRGGFDPEYYNQITDNIALPEIETSLPLAEVYEGIDIGRS